MKRFKRYKIGIGLCVIATMLLGFTSYASNASIAHPVTAVSAIKAKQKNRQITSQPSKKSVQDYHLASKAIPTLADVAFHDNTKTTALIKAIQKNSNLYAFNLGFHSVSPDIYGVLYDTVAFSQRALTNQLLTKLVSLSRYGLRNPQTPLATGAKALVLHVDNKQTVPFFSFIHLYHGEKFVHDCLIPLVEKGAVTLGQLHQAWNVFQLLAVPDNYPERYFPNHVALSCAKRADKWNNLWMRERNHHISQRYEAVRLLQQANREKLPLTSVEKNKAKAQKQQQKLAKLLLDSYISTLVQMQQPLASGKWLSPSSDDAQTKPVDTPAVKNPKPVKPHERFDIALPKVVPHGNGGIDAGVSTANTSSQKAMPEKKKINFTPLTKGVHQHV